MPATEKRTQPMTETELLDRLNTKYCPPEWAFLPQTADGTGIYKRRTIDGIAMNLWPSRGLAIHGFEIKVQRADFLRELKNPKKADDAIKHCDYWWIVAADKQIVKNGELPPTWGLMVPHGRGLRIKVTAPPLKENRLSHLDRAFVAGILRKATEYYGSFAQRAAVRKEIWEEVEKGFRKEHKQEMAETEKIKATMKEFQEASGISVYEFTASGKPKAVGTIVKAVLGNYGGLLWKLESARDRAHDAYEGLAKIAEELIGSIKSKQEDTFNPESRDTGSLERGNEDGE